MVPDIDADGADVSDLSSGQSRKREAISMDTRGDGHVCQTQRNVVTARTCLDKKLNVHIADAIVAHVKFE